MKGDRLLRPTEVARYFAVSRSTIYRWFWEGRIQGVKLSGGSLRILESSMEKLVAEVW